VLVALLFLAGCTATTPDPEPACPAETAAALEAWAEAGFSGTVAISTGERFDCLDGYGTADPATGAPNTPDTVFDIGSVTKVFTAAVVFSLVDQGKLRLDAPVAQYLPELTGPVRAATIRQLLLHTSGLNGTHGDDSEPMSPDAALAAISRLDVAFPPGERHLYSNAGYTLLALVVERFGGYRDLLASRILPPGAGFWHGQPAPRGPRAVGEVGQTGPFWGLEGNGGIAMSAKDLAAWTRAYFTGQAASPEPAGWASADASVYGTPFLSAAGGGGDTGHNVVVAWVPARERVVVIASNGSEVDAEDLLAAIGPALLAGDPLPRPTTVEVDAAMVGTYTLGTGGSFEVTGDGKITASGADAIAALFPRQAGFGEHEERVTAMLDGRTQEGREERAQLADTRGAITAVSVDGTVDHDGEVRTYVTIVAGGRPLLGWYALNEEGGIEGVEVPTTPPGLRLADAGVSFGDDELTISGTSVTARRGG
jgi:CubicO group peptidase (beta-lactamase class C family)